MKRSPKFAAFLTALALIAGARAAVPDMVPQNENIFSGAPEPDAGPEPRGVEVAQDFVPLEIILQALRNEYGGHQLTVTGPSRTDEGFVYRIKWLTEDGAVLYVTADAESGEVLSLEGE